MLKSTRKSRRQRTHRLISSENIQIKSIWDIIRYLELEFYILTRNRRRVPDALSPMSGNRSCAFTWFSLTVIFSRYKYRNLEDRFKNNQTLLISDMKGKVNLLILKWSKIMQKIKNKTFTNFWFLHPIQFIHTVWSAIKSLHVHLSLCGCRA